MRRGTTAAVTREFSQDSRRISKLGASSRLMRRDSRGVCRATFWERAKPRKAKPATEGGVSFAGDGGKSMLATLAFPEIRQRVKRKLCFR